MIMKTKVLSALCFSFLLSASLYAQEPLSQDMAKQVDKIAAMIKDNPDAAEDAFDELLKGKNKKNVSLLVAIGRAYLDNGKIDAAKEFAEDARKADSKNGESYVLQGDIALSVKDVGTACGFYEQAILFDEDCFEAYYKYANAYIGVNPQLSVNMLLKLKEKHPGEIRVDRELANAYYQMGSYGKAKQVFDEYMQKGQPDVQDYSRYSMLLYLNKDYAQSLDMVNKGLALEADNHLLKRLKMYDLYETKAYVEGIQAGDVFFADPNNPDFVYMDYLYRARLYAANNEIDKAMVEFDKAMKADETTVHPEIAKEASEAQQKAQNYPEAIRLYKQYLDEMNDKAEVTDLFMFGRLYYMAAGALSTPVADSTQTEAPIVAAVDTIQMKAYLVEADTIFAQVAERVPDNYLGNFWRARTNAMLDPETSQGLAKPYYEKALAILEQNPKASKNVLIECESYLGYYYFLKEEYEQSKVYWEKILAIDPENATAKQAMEGLQP
ncbi:tetratricopeptide repeat protein [Phocaeicola salanitronis]|jgi:tetratricopeptide (TPR) repeat protein|nr:tetratricopeptide repeat protein [Phocaeicola salanitronis]